MRQQWNPRTRRVNGDEDGGGARMRWRWWGAGNGTLECGKLDVNGLGECGKAKKFGKKGGQKEISYYRRMWPRRVCTNKKK